MRNREIVSIEIISLVYIWKYFCYFFRFSVILNYYLYLSTLTSRFIFLPDCYLQYLQVHEDLKQVFQYLKKKKKKMQENRSIIVFYLFSRACQKNLFRPIGTLIYKNICLLFISNNIYTEIPFQVFVLMKIIVI